MAILEFQLKKYRQEGDMQHTYAPLRNLIKSDNSISEFNTKELNIDLNNPLSIDCQPSYDGTVNLIINDDKNPPRLINTRFSRIENNRYRIITRNQLHQTNLYREGKIDQQTRLIRNVNNIPKFELSIVRALGQLMGGNYTFYIKYADEDQNQTDIVAESGQVAIFHGSSFNIASISGTLQDERTDKAIVFNLSNLDTSFSAIYVYYTREYCDQNGIRLTEAKYLVDPIPIKSSTQDINITGYEDTIDITIDELNITHNHVQCVKTQTQVQNRLFFGNVQESDLNVSELQNISYFIEVAIKQQEESIGYISHKYTQKSTDDLSQIEYYSPYHIYYHLGYWPDEMYRLGIVYILNDDSLTPAFNLRGCVFDTLGQNNFRSKNITSQLYSHSGQKNYLERDVLLDNGEHLDNTFGVFKNPKCSLYNDETTKPIYYELTLSNEVLSELRKHNIKGYFIVRQKRIPTILAQGLSVGVDSSSYIPMISIGQSDAPKYVTEGFLNSGNILTEDFESRKIETDAKQSSALLCVDANVTPTLQSMLDGSEYVFEPVAKLDLMQNNRHFYAQNRTNLESTQLTANAIFVNSDIPLKWVNECGFSTRAGSATDVKSFGFFKQKVWKPVNGSVPPYVRGIYCPMIGITKTLADNQIYNIRIKEYSSGYWKEYFTIRGNDNSPFFAISDRYELPTSEQKINVYRGDCYSNTVSIRINRNFVDPDFPINEIIVDNKTWKDNYKGYLNTPAENWSKINRTDLNSVPMGMWITFKCLSSYNLGLRAFDRTYTDEQALLGNARGFYPIHGISTSAALKLEESWLLNDGYNATVGQKTNSIVQNVPYINDLFDNRIMFSNMQVDSAFKNNYRVFQGLSYGDIDRQYGAIVKLLPWDTHLFCVFEHGLAIIPVNEKALIQTATGQSIHMYGAGVIQNQVSLISGDFGSVWAESIIQTPIGIYGVDTYAKKIWKFSKQNGLEIISDMRIQRFLNDNILLKEDDKYPIVSLLNVKSHYNNYKGDVMFTFYNFKENAEWNFCFNERLNKWITRYSWTPLYSENINNTFYSLDKQRAEILANIYYNKTDEYGLKVDNSQWSGHVVNDEFVLNDKFETDITYKLPSLMDDFNMSIIQVTSSYIKNVVDEESNQSYDVEEFIQISPHLIHLIKYSGGYKLYIDRQELKNTICLSDNKYCLDIPMYFKIDVCIEFVNNTSVAIAKKHKRIGIIVDSSADPDQFAALLCNGVYIHGRSNIVDEISPTEWHNQIKPTFWYNKQEPFEFEFVVSQPAGLHKIFNNLIIISNRVQPKEFEFEIIGDVYDFKKSGIVNDVSKFKNTQIEFDAVLNQYMLRTTQFCKNINSYGRRRGNIQYKEDSWYTTIEPIVYDNKSARIRDKFIKIRVKYSGENQVIITALKTLFTLSYS